MKKNNLIILGLFSLLNLTACGSQNAQKSKEETVLPTVNIAISEEGKGSDLDANSYNAAMPLYGAVYQPLVEYGQKGEFQSGLAKSWEVSKDLKKYTFHLEKDVYFSDGSTFDAKSVKFSLERAKALNKDSKLQTLSNLSNIETPDAHTIILNFNKISNQVLNELCQTRPLRIMSPNAVEGGKTDGKFKKPIGTGAMILKKATTEDTKMVANPYFNGKHRVKYQINFKTITDASSRALAMKSGQIDIIGGTLSDINRSEMKSLAKTFKKSHFEGTSSHFLTFNPNSKDLVKELREAITLGVDQSQLTSKKMIGIFPSTDQFVTKENQPKKKYNALKAKKIIEGLGYKLDGRGFYEKNGKELAFKLVIQTAEFPEWKSKAEIVESQLQKIGVKANISMVDSETYYDILWKTQKYDLIFYRTYTDALMPYNFMKTLFYSSPEMPGVLAHDEMLSSLIDDFEKSVSKDDQQECFNKIFERFNQNYYALPIDYHDETFLTSDKIKQFSFSGLSDAPIDFAKLLVNND